MSPRTLALAISLIGLAPLASGETEPATSPTLIDLGTLIAQTGAYQGQIVTVRGLMDECVVSCTLAVGDRDAARLTLDPTGPAMAGPHVFRFAEVEITGQVLIQQPDAAPGQGYDLTPLAPPRVIASRASPSVAKPDQGDDRLVRLAPGSLPDLSVAAREVFAEIGARDIAALEFRHSLFDPDFAAMLDRFPEERMAYRLELIDVLFEGSTPPSDGLADGKAGRNPIALFQDPATEADFIAAMGAEAAVSVCVCLQDACAPDDWPVRLVDTLPNRANAYHCVDAVKRKGRWRAAPF